MKNVKSILGKRWFWLIVILAASGVIGAVGGKDELASDAAGTHTAESFLIASSEPSPIMPEEAAPSEPAAEPSANMRPSIEPAPSGEPSPAVEQASAPASEQPGLAAEEPSGAAAETAPPAAPAAAEDIRLISITSPVSRNNTATLEIKGEPNTEYAITVYYSSGPSSAAGLESKYSDGEGYVSWSWRVGGKTKDGEYRIIVSGGGKSLETEFAVK